MVMRDEDGIDVWERQREEQAECALEGRAWWPETTAIAAAAPLEDKEPAMPKLRATALTWNEFADSMDWSADAAPYVQRIRAYTAGNRDWEVVDISWTNAELHFLSEPLDDPNFGMREEFDLIEEGEEPR